MVFNKRFVKKAVCVLLLTFILGGFFPIVHADIKDEIAERNIQIEALRRQIEQYEAEIAKNQAQAKTLNNAIAKLNAEINQIELEVRSLNLSIEATTLEIGDTEATINNTERRIEALRNGLAGFLRTIDQQDQESLLEVLLKNENISDFFIERDNLHTAQAQAKVSIENLRNLKSDLEIKKESLETKQEDLEYLKTLQEVEQNSLAYKRSEQRTLLRETQGEEKKYQKLVEVTRQDIQRIGEQIQFLLKHGISAEDAVKFAQLAAISAGIRPAFLLAILEIESNLGRNIGSGNWYDDMYDCYLRIGRRDRAEAEKAAFMKIVNELGLDPDAVKVSAEPYYGCGGAMGPAQFIPTTWLGYREEVARLTGHNPPNPWNFEDAFTASAIKLARGGATAQNANGETRAAKAYISGSPYCTRRICNSYARSVLRKAAEIQKNLPSN